MAESRDFPGAADDISTAYARFLLRTAAHSTRGMHLCEQVIGCVARRQLTPDSLQASLAQFMQQHADPAAAQTAAAAARFFAGLVSTALLPADPDDLPPDVDPTDLTATLGRVADNSAQRNARAMEAYQALIGEVAAGRMTPYKFRRAIGKQYEQFVAGELTRVARLWFEFLADLEDARGSVAEPYLLGELRNAGPLGFDADVVELAGPMNATGSAELSVENTGGGRDVIRCTVGDVRRADGIGPAFLPDIVLTPDELVLDQGRAASLRLSVRLDETIYDAGVPYIGALHFLRDSAPRLQMPLRITSHAGIAR
jgi:hypothetical protein